MWLFDGDNLKRWEFVSLQIESDLILKFHKGFVILQVKVFFLTVGLKVLVWIQKTTQAL